MKGYSKCYTICRVMSFSMTLITYNYLKPPYFVDFWLPVPSLESDEVTDMVDRGKYCPACDNSVKSPANRRGERQLIGQRVQHLKFVR